MRVLLFSLFPSYSIRYLDSPYTSNLMYEEGLAYIQNNLSPYFEGSPVHAPPILLLLYSNLSRYSLFALLQIIDLFSAYFLYKYSKHLPSVLFYYLNPFSLYISMRLSMAPLVTFFLILFLYFSQNRRRIKAAFTLGWLWYIDPSLGIISSIWVFQHFTYRIYFHSAFMLGVLITTSNIIAGDNWVFFT